MIVTPYGRGRRDAVDQQQPDELEDEHAADEREQVPPPPEHHQRDEQADRDDGHRPAGRHPVDALDTSVSQSVRSRAIRAQDRGVDPVGDPPRPRRQQHHDHPHDEQHRRSTSQPLPLMPMLRGSGGGAPDGRRRRWPRGSPARSAASLLPRPAARASVVTRSFSCKPLGRDRGRVAPRLARDLCVQIAEHPS